MTRNKVMEQHFDLHYNQTRQAVLSEMIDRICEGKHINVEWYGWQLGYDLMSKGMKMGVQAKKALDEITKLDQQKRKRQ